MNTTSPKPISPRIPHPKLELDDDELAALGADGGEPEVKGFTGAQIRGDSLAEGLGEDFVRVATSGEDDAEDMLDEVYVEELGGPFVESTGAEEFSYEMDPGDPEESTPTLRTGPPSHRGPTSGSAEITRRAAVSKSP